MNGFSFCNRIIGERKHNAKELEEKIMKKIVSVVSAVVLVFFIGTVCTFAAGPERGNTFTDADSNGICDNYETSGTCLQAGIGCGGNFTDADSNGICDNYETSGTCLQAGIGCGGNFTDVDGDGICDNRMGKSSPQHGKCKGNSFRRGQTK